jgi:hypothetical protein
MEELILAIIAIPFFLAFGGLSIGMLRYWT